jgi:heptosyltransferase I
VKLSSLGDVLHNLPIVWDLRKRLPHAQIDWIVEEGYVHLLEPLKTTETFRGIDRIIPVAFRRWRKNLFSIKPGVSFLPCANYCNPLLTMLCLRPKGF